MLHPRNIRRARLHANLTQAELAKLANVSQSLVAKIESGSIDPRFSSVERLTNALASAESRAGLTVAAVMSRAMVSVGRDDPLVSAVKLMRTRGISQVPVTAEGAVVGLLTEADIVEALAAGKDARSLAVRAVMRPAPTIIPSTTAIDVATRLLEDSPLVVVRDGVKLIGVVTRSDVLGAALRR